MPSRSVTETYRQLRMGMIALVALLSAAVLLDARASSWVFQMSISEYYYTSAHVVFIVVLCALGTCLIVYKGSTEAEDVVLNFSGFMAFVVAMVPTDPRESFAYRIDDSVGTSVSALLVVGAAAAVISFCLSRVMARRTGDLPPPSAERRTTPMMEHLASLTRRNRALRPFAEHFVPVVRWLGWTLVGVLTVVFLVARGTFIADAHIFAAVSMFAGIILVVVINARLAYRHRATNSLRFFWGYLVIAVLMFVTVIAAAVLALNHVGYVVIVVETLLIAEFTVFWIVQTLDLWNVGVRSDSASEP